MSSIISIINNISAPTIDNTIQLNTSSLESYMNDYLNNFYILKHDANRIQEIKEIINNNSSNTNTNTNTKNIQVNNIIDSNSDISNNDIIEGTLNIKPTPLELSKNTYHNNYNRININKQYINNTLIQKDLGPCAGIAFNLGSPPTFEVTFSLDTPSFNIPLNLNVVIPNFSIYDSDVGLNLIDYIPVVDNDCDYNHTADDGILVFPGLPCAPPAITWCQACKSFRLFGRRFRICSPPYPCDIKIKTNYAISLEKANFIPSKLFEFEGFGISINGNINQSYKFSFDFNTNMNIFMFSDLIKNFSIDIWNSITNKGTTQPTSIKSIMDSFKKFIINIDFLFSFSRAVVKYLNKIAFGQTYYVNFVITSIKLSAKFDLNYFRINYGSEKIEVTDLSDSVTDFELLRDGRYISLNFNGGANTLTAKFNLITKPLYEVLNADNMSIVPQADGGILDVVLALIAKKTRVSSVPNTVLTVYNSLLSIKNALTTAPGLSTLTKKYKPMVSYALGICWQLEAGTVFVGMATIQVMNVNVIQFIKDTLVELWVDLQTGKYYEEMSDSIINAVPIPEIRNVLRPIVNKVQDANNLYRGLIIIALQKALSFLDVLDTGLEISPSISYSWPLG
jgi:hypothetical protein